MMRRLMAICVAAGILVACAEAPATEPIARGRQVFRSLDCGRCHRVGGDGGTSGPDLTHVGSAAEARKPGVGAEDYLRESLLSPGAYVVPGYPDTMPRGLARGLSAADLDALIAYLRAQR